MWPSAPPDCYSCVINRACLAACFADHTAPRVSTTISSGSAYARGIKQKAKNQLQ